jgi:hypothetical protein
MGPSPDSSAQMLLDNTELTSMEDMWCQDELQHLVWKEESKSKPRNRPQVVIVGTNYIIKNMS